MSLLEFLLVLVSVVIGLGLAEILAGAANLLRARATVRFYWIHLLLQIGIFLALIQQWWETWELQNMGEISFWGVLALLSSPVVLFLIAHLLYPVADDGADLREYYFEQAPVLWTLVLIGTLVGTGLRPLALGNPVLEINNASAIPSVAMAAALAMSRRERLHSILAPLMLVVLILDTLLARSVISVG